MSHPGGSEQRDKEGDDNVRPRRRKRQRMTRSVSDSIHETESDGDGETEPVLCKPRSSRRMVVAGRQQRNVDNEDFYSPSQDSDSEWDAQPSRPKRRKLRSPPPTGHTAARATRATRHHASSNYAGTRPRQVLSPPSSQGRSNTTAGFIAEFKERQIENAILKWRETDGIVLFRLEWSEDMRCADHKSGDPHGSLRSKPLPKRRGPSKRKATTRVAFTLDANSFLAELKEEQGLKWDEIHRRLTDRFPSPERSVGCLQVHYCTKLKRRAEEG
ncbi:hypothetical protein F5883DRAFT_516218 [Diaporthe sp. PMI_573]|nr:hypothetical protein F5883DRAFT_516218 [Diaporthaceae sp. PMI_573]